MSDACAVPESVFSAVFGSGGGGIPDDGRDLSSTAFLMSSSSLTAGLRDFNFRLQITYIIIEIMTVATGIITEGTIVLICLSPPPLLLPIMACEDEVDEREEDGGEDVGD